MEWVRVEGWLWCVIWGGKFSTPHYHFIHDIDHGSLQLLTKRRLGQSCPCYYHCGRGRHLFIIRPLLDFDVKWAVANFSPCVGGFGGFSGPITISELCGMKWNWVGVQHAARNLFDGKIKRNKLHDWCRCKYLYPSRYFHYMITGGWLKQMLRNFFELAPTCHKALPMCPIPDPWIDIAV